MHDSIVVNTSKLRRYYRSSNHNWFYDSHYRFLNNARWCLNGKEAKTLAKLVSMNVPVYVSFGDNEKADLVADFNGKLNKLQVKTSEKFEDNKFTVSLKSSTIRNQVNYVHRYDASEIDYFVVYNLASDTLLMLPIKEFEGRNAVSFRIPYVETHNQHKSLNYEDYLFDKIVNV